jgi:hypothetical protein
MDQIKNNKIFLVLLAVTLFNVGAFFVGKVVIDRAADRVIQKLQKDYSPSKYGPGLDPDKVGPDFFKGPQQYFEQRKVLPSTVFADEPVLTGTASVERQAADADGWRTSWEAERGASR